MVAMTEVGIVLRLACMMNHRDAWLQYTSGYTFLNLEHFILFYIERWWQQR